MWIDNKSLSGFTLLEALVALAILAGASAVLVQMVAMSYRAQAEAAADQYAARQARALLARAGRDIPLKAGAQSGISKGGQTWSVVIQPFEGEVVKRSSVQGLFLVQIHIKGDALPPSGIEVSTLKRFPR